MSTALESSHDPMPKPDSPTVASGSGSTSTTLTLAVGPDSAEAGQKAPSPPQSSEAKPQNTTGVTMAATSLPSHAEEQGRGEVNLRQGPCGNEDSLVEEKQSKAAYPLHHHATQESATSPPSSAMPSLSSSSTSSQLQESLTSTSSSADTATDAEVTETACVKTGEISGADSPPVSASSAPRAGSRFSMNLASVGLTQASGERAVDMAQDLKKNVVNLWNTWFPTPSSTLASVATGPSSASPDPLSSSPNPRSSTFSGSHTLSHHHMQSPRQPVAERPAKTVRINSTSALPSLGTSSSGSSTNAGPNNSMSTIPSSSTPSKHTHRQSNSSSRSNSPSLLPGLQLQTPQEGSESSIEPATMAPVSQPPQPRSNTPIYLMGKLYPPSPTQWTDFQSDFTNGLIWCTYRHSYAPIRPSNFTTDVGWGCMLRSGQSLLANALAVQFLGRGWTRPSRNDPFWDIYVKTISWFFDDMTSRSPFSVHRIALLGKQLGKNIGEWFGPSTTSQVIKALVDNYPESGLSVYVTTDGVIYKDQAEQTATMKGKGSFGHLLILATIRLGIDKVNPVYHNAIKATFELPQSLGIAGGRPSSSYYFVGYQDSDLFYLDPHHSRCMVEVKDLNEYTEENLATYHCDTIRKIDIGGVDPSMLIAFYCKDRSDFDIFCKQIQAMNELLKSDVTAAGQPASEIISIGERAPVYDSGDDMDGHLLTVADEEDDDLELVL